MDGEPFRLWLSRQRNGQYMLTKLRPAVAPIAGNSGQIDLYMQVGDPVGYRNICQEFVSRVWGVVLEPLQSQRVSLTGTVFTKGN